jgi:hypothetical protein
VLFIKVTLKIKLFKTMAQLLDSTFGKVRGKIGEFVIRNMNGKTFISARPQRVRVSKDPAAVARRKRFAMAANISACLNRNELLKKVWVDSVYKKDKKAYNLMLKHFYPYVSEDDIMKDVSLTPGFGNGEISIRSLSVKEEMMSVVINPIDLEKSFNSECKDAKFVQMVTVWKSTDKYYRSDKAKFILLESELEEIEKGETVRIYNAIEGCERRVIEDGVNHRVMIVFFLLDEELNPVGYSETYDFDVKEVPYEESVE